MEMATDNRSKAEHDLILIYLHTATRKYFATAGKVYVYTVTAATARVGYLSSCLCCGLSWIGAARTSLLAVCKAGLRTDWPLR